MKQYPTVEINADRRTKRRQKVIKFEKFSDIIAMEKT